VCDEIYVYNKPSLIIITFSSYFLISAPISKVIDYLPKNIPRILINRTIVHPPEPVDDEEDGEQKYYDFRKDYVFDAYLLGYCDVVTRALAHDLFQKDATSNVQKNKDLKEAELLYTVLKSGKADSSYNADDWSSVKIPSERVFLFQGAQPQPQTATATGTTTYDISFREIAHCDNCTKLIEGVIQKCIVCFDYDLCQECYPILSKTHYNGTHQFTTESVSSEYS
jgi:hypothetical protein